MKAYLMLAAAALVIALPFLFRRAPAKGDWRVGDPELIIVSPHNEAIRHEFAEGFSRWHQRNFGKPVRIDWRVIGGTSEIMRYLTSEYQASARRYVKGALHGDDTSSAAQTAMLTVDDPSKITCGMDLFFGGGCYDHGKAERLGLSVPAWSSGGPPVGLFADARGRVLIPEEMNGEVWRGKAYYGTVLSAFGICYNIDRLHDLGIEKPPAAWPDLADARYFGKIGLADPTKSGSVAKAFEMIIHARCAQAVKEAGYSAEQVARFESAIAAAGQAESGMPADVPDNYQASVARGWVEGVNLVRRIGANARYFTDVAVKVPGDVCAGEVAAGVSIDFLARLQAELATPPGTRPVLSYVTPVGGSSVTADPISLLRGAPHRELSVRFIEFVLGEEGQKLWDYRVGTPGGPTRFALRRLPIRRDFYPSDDAEWKAVSERHRPYLADPVWQPDVNAYELGASFHYVGRWTGRHFGVQRDLIRAMCIDSGQELREAWRAILEHGGPGRNHEAMRLLEAMPQKPFPLDWDSALHAYTRASRMDLLREWTAFFRAQYRLAGAAAMRN